MCFPFFLRLAYVGTRFYGWQIQTTLRSVQGELWKALRALDPEAPMPQGTGRTDAGVHARAQGVLVATSRDWEPYRLLAALNAHLPGDARVMTAEPAPEGFFPRHHAVAKRYVYKLQEGPSADPFLRDRAWHQYGKEPLDREAMAQAAAHLVGDHDFSSFRASECSAKTTTRILFKVELLDLGAAMDLVFEGNRFLMHQVRIMTGTLVDVGRGRKSPDSIPGILDARDRRESGISAPAHGLYMDQVWYQRRWGIGEASPWPEPMESEA
ncbi:MAG: tRNA pseudouridine(38-40) synthase TruA [Acidobacteriota bacterium]|nr:tRNA pseudouridine(38-40) synthase TruA [Acidobacteriota bacterium]